MKRWPRVFKIGPVEAQTHCINLHSFLEFSDCSESLLETQCRDERLTYETSGLQIPVIRSSRHPGVRLSEFGFLFHVKHRRSRCRTSYIWPRSREGTAYDKVGRFAGRTVYVGFDPRAAVKRYKFADGRPSVSRIEHARGLQMTAHAGPGATFHVKHWRSRNKNSFRNRPFAKPSRVRYGHTRQREKISTASGRADPYIRVPLAHENAAAIQSDIFDF